MKATAQRNVLQMLGLELHIGFLLVMPCYHIRICWCRKGFTGPIGLVLSLTRSVVVVYACRIYFNRVRMLPVLGCGVEISKGLRPQEISVKFYLCSSHCALMTIRYTRGQLGLLAGVHVLPQPTTWV